MVTEEVQIALINFEYHKISGDLIHECPKNYAKQVCGNENVTCPELLTMCNTAPARFFDEKARCDTTREMAELAHVAGLAGRHNGFRPARSHFSLRTMQQTAGFLMQNELGTYTTCTEDPQFIPTSVSKQFLFFLTRRCLALLSSRHIVRRYYLPRRSLPSEEK